MYSILIVEHDTTESQYFKRHFDEKPYDLPNIVKYNIRMKNIFQKYGVKNVIKSI